MSRLLVSLFTDASWCPAMRVGGWGAWFRAGDEIKRRGGAFRTLLRSSTLAEAAAIANGAALVARRHPGSEVLIQTDCEGAILLLEPVLKTWGWSRRTETAAIKTAFLEAVTAGDLAVRLRHVPGHAGNGEPRTAVNEWCDREAKRHMRAARAEMAIAKKRAEDALLALRMGTA